MSAEEAKAYGLVDEILHEDGQIADEAKSGGSPGRPERARARSLRGLRAVSRAADACDAGPQTELHGKELETWQ